MGANPEPLILTFAAMAHMAPLGNHGQGMALSGKMAVPRHVDP